MAFFDRAFGSLGLLYDDDDDANNIRQCCELEIMCRKMLSFTMKRYSAMRFSSYSLFIHMVYLFSFLCVLFVRKLSSV